LINSPTGRSLSKDGVQHLVFSTWCSVGNKASVITGLTDCSRTILSHRRTPLPHFGFPVTLGCGAFGELVLGHLSIVVVHGLPCLTRFVNIGGVGSARNLLRSVLQFHVDPMPL
jgi:hypothetical protein